MTAPTDSVSRISAMDMILPGVFRVRFRLPDEMPEPVPGQFLQLEATPGLFPVTRRPFTVNRMMDDIIEVIFEEVGWGTSLLASLEPGDPLRILGPLGNGWRGLDRGRWLLVGGGLGAAGFQFLLDRINCAEVVLGASDAGRILPLKTDSPVFLATEDGSTGTTGLVTDLLSPDLLAKPENIAVCGPIPMMNAVWRMIPEASRGRVQVSTESRMGCGWGVCEGCSIPSTDGGYVKCCSEGPVFPGKVIDWDRWMEVGL